MNRLQQKSKKSLLFGVIITGLFFIFSFYPLSFTNLHYQSAKAAISNYQAGIVRYYPKQNIKLKAGTTIKLRINYINNGKTSWLNSGTTAVKLKADSTAQKFINAKWLNDATPTKLFYSKVKSGESIWFDFYITAPKINGSYNLGLSLMAGANSIKNSNANFKIEVSGGQKPIANNPPSQTKIINGLTEVLSITNQQKNNLPITIPSDNYQLKSGERLFDQTKLGNQFSIDFSFDLKKYFINDQSGQRILMTDEIINFIPADATTQLTMTVGNQQYNFCGHLQFNYQSASQTLSVLTDAPSSCYPKLIPNQTPSTVNFWQSVPAEITIANDLRMTEPILKVGLLYETDDSDEKLPFKIHTLNNQPYEVRREDNTLITLATTGDLLSVDFDFNLKKTFLNDQSGQRILMTDEPLHFVAQSPETIFEIASWKNGPFWGMNVNDNDYRGNIIVEYNPNTERFWLINELAMEKYMQGICEVSDSWPSEFLKTQQIAARTYAMFRYLTPKYTNTPDEDPIITLRATQADQVYRGYQAELRNANTVQANNDTHGLIATYNNNPILAYYFAQTDGHTRNSVEAGMTKGPVDYLKGVDDPPGQGRTLKGHGVGLPQYGGKIAADQGANFSQILKYYYPGIEIKRFYP